MEEEKEREREEGGKRAAGKPLGAGGREGKRAAGKPLPARRKEKERRKGRREEKGQRENRCPQEGGKKEGGRLGGEQEKSAPSGERWGGFVNCGGIRGDYLRSTFLPFLMTMPL